MTAAKLKELVARATDGLIHEGFSNEIVAQDTGQTYKVTHVCKSSNGEIIAWFKDHKSAKLYIHLRNHAQDFIRLMEAAEYWAKEYSIAEDSGELQHWPTREIAAAKATYEALAAFKEQP